MLFRSKRAAIERLGFGTLAKVGLRFEKVFWPSQVYVFGLEEGGGDDATVVVNKAAVDGSPLLTLLAGGALGRRIESLPDEDAVAWAMAKIRRAFGAAAPDPVAVFRTSWSRDPFARGAYSFVAAGSSAADLAALAAPVGDRLFFAGEATNASQWAVAHGAYISGLREAARITGDASLLPPRNFTENRRWRGQMARASRFFNLRIATLDSADLEERVRLLADCEAFADIAAAELRLLATMLEPQSIRAGEWLCRAGERANRVFLVAEGTLEVVLDDASTPARTVGPGDLAGEYGMFSGLRRTASLRGRTDVRLLVLDYQRFERFLLAFPQATLALLRRAVGRLA